uniref:Uncharacterized protein n=1 Tax=Anopheles dirus TaxID=7168 RepID=A0A182MXT4_9DIPT
MDATVDRVDRDVPIEARPSNERRIPRTPRHIKVPLVRRGQLRQDLSVRVVRVLVPADDPIVLPTGRHQIVILRAPGQPQHAALMNLERFRRCRRIPQIPQLYRRCRILLAGQPQLRGHLRMPLGHPPADARLRITQLYDRLVLPQVPDYAPRRKHRRQDVLHLPVPRQPLHVLVRGHFRARAHRDGRVVQIPDEDLRLGRTARDEIVLERVVVEAPHRTLMLLLLRHERVLAGQQLCHVVHLQHAVLASTGDETARGGAGIGTGRPGQRLIEYSSRAAVVLKDASSCWAAVPAANIMGACWAGDQATFTIFCSSFTFMLCCAADSRQFRLIISMICAYRDDFEK